MFGAISRLPSRLSCTWTSHRRRASLRLDYALNSRLPKKEQDAIMSSMALLTVLLGNHQRREHSTQQQTQ